MFPQKNPNAKGAQFVKPRPPKKVVKNEIVPKLQESEVVERCTDEEPKDLISCCVVCGKVPPPNSYLCEVGHMTCAECVLESDVEVCRFALKSKQWRSSKQHDDREGTCLKKVKRTPCLVYHACFPLSQIECPAEECNAIIRVDQFSEHLKTCIGAKNLTCPESKCKSLGPWSKAELLAHLQEAHSPVADTGVLRLFIVQPWWFENGRSRVAVMMTHKNFMWIGVAKKEIFNGREACVLILYEITDVDPGKSSSSDRNTTFVANLTFWMRNGMKSETWRGDPPSIYGNEEEEIIASKRCLIVNERSQDIRFLEFDIMETPINVPHRLPQNIWRGNKGTSI